MRSPDVFETFCRSTPPAAAAEAPATEHVFETRNIYPELPPKVRRLFDDGYYSEATLNAFKYVEQRVKAASGLRGRTGRSLMMAAFDPASPRVKLSLLENDSEIDEQEGYRFMFAGGSMAIRNPLAHEWDLEDDPDNALDHLSFATMLLRRLDASQARGR